MRRITILVGLAFMLAAAILVVSPDALADEISLLQAIEKVESETKMLVVQAAVAGNCYQVVVIGEGKTKNFNVDRATGKVELSREKDWSEKSEKIAAAAKVPCSKAAADALNECKGELRSVKVSLGNDGSVEFHVFVRTEAKGNMMAKVCAASGKVGTVEPTEGAPTEGCE
ncbi:MAG: hypothetical protein AB1696_11230 [Planctomycetota bacterium]